MKLSEEEKDAIFAVFTHICMQSEFQIIYQIDSLRKVGHLIGLDPKYFKEMTGFPLTYEEDNLLEGLMDMFKYMAYEGEQVIENYFEQIRLIAHILDLSEMEFIEYMERPLYDYEPDWEDYCTSVRYI